MEKLDGMLSFRSLFSDPFRLEACSDLKFRVYMSNVCVFGAPMSVTMGILRDGVTFPGRPDLQIHLHAITAVHDRVEVLMLR